MRRRRWPRRLAAGAGLVLVVSGAGGGWFYARLRASLPILDGELPLPGLADPVRIERDARGVPLVRGRSRLDVARATGFVHAQERFFQMDLMRRRAAGELAELVGAAGLEVDREVRPLRLRQVARRATAALPPGRRALIAAYADGVAAGVAALGAPPFEYLALRQAPASWREEDALLCALAMALTLQGGLPDQESDLGVMHDILPEPLFEFLAPMGTEWDAPLEGPALEDPPLPGPEVVDLRRRPAADTPLARAERADVESDVVHGSNNWAVAGSRSATGAAIVANDMHLGLAVPNTWFHASLVFEQDGTPRQVTGVMLPGAPFVVAGSNGRIAWGFTNTEGDWADLVVLEPVAGDADVYRTPQGPQRIVHGVERIHVRGEDDVTVELSETVFGPVLDRDHARNRRAIAWVALRDGALNAELVGLEAASNVDEALALAATVGIPNQNLVVGDSSGGIGWTIIGRIPRRFGHDGRLPRSWADGSRGWDGWLDADDYPRVVDPPSGRIWTANARVVGGEKLRLVGFGGYDLGARQRQIRDDLFATARATEADMLRIQLDDRALFLARWRRLLLELLTSEELARHPGRAEANRLVREWGGRAAIGSVGYRIVRGFRRRVAELALAPLLAPCAKADPRFDYLGLAKRRRAQRQFEGPLWRLVRDRPPHLLDARFASWRALLLAALDSVLEELTAEGRRLAERNWGERNSVLVGHPLSLALPVLGRLLDMPRLALPGDNHMPRVQSPSAGASERFAVSPGREREGYFHMPAGQSGHPLSPHYGDGHAAWARGEPRPFLPGPAAHVLTLTPLP